MPSIMNPRKFPEKGREGGRERVSIVANLSLTSVAKKLAKGG